MSKNKYSKNKNIALVNQVVELSDVLKSGEKNYVVKNYELTKEVDATFHELEGYKEHNKQLQEEVERLRKERHILLLDFYKGLKNIGRLYSDNTSEEIMMNDVSEFLTTH